MDYSFAAQLEHLTALRAHRHFQMRFSLESGHIHFAAKSGDRKRDRQFAIKIVFIALEDFVFLNMNHDVKIAMWPSANAGLTISRRTQTRAFADSSGDFQFDPAQFLHPTIAITLRARLFDSLAGPATSWTGL